MTSAAEIPDPRVFPDADSASPDAARLYALAGASLGAETGQRADALDREIRAELMSRLLGDGATLEAIFAGAPSVAAARHLWRQLDAAWRESAADAEAGLAVGIFAMPLVIVTGLEVGSGMSALSGVLHDPAALAAILREHVALAGNRTFALANALVSTDAIDMARLPEIFAWQRLPDSVAPGATLPPRVLAPAPVTIATGSEAVHLRFLVGSALARSGADILGDATVGTWGIPFAQELHRQLGAGNASVLVLPRAPQHLLPAVAQGRTAQRETGAQIFASNAIRKLRAAVGEPSAVISAHRAPDAPGGGEVRLSLSSPFETRAAEGFRCPLHPLDRVGDVVTMLTELLRDCRVTDVRVLAGVHADRHPGTGLPLLFKPETIPDAVAGQGFPPLGSKIECNTAGPTDVAPAAPAPASRTVSRAGPA
jgi:hypothetical protein